MDMPPLIVTLEPDAGSRALFDALRRAHFPPERLVVDAHVTVFHALPGEEIDTVADALARSAATTPSLCFVAETPAPLSRRGVAIPIACPSARDVKRRLLDEFAFALTPQDRGGMRPHVTVQNKVDPETAAATLAHLRAGWVPHTGRFEGLALWRYRGGPWEAVADWRLSGDA